MDGKSNCSADQGKRSFFVQRQRMLCLFGGSSLTQADRSELTALFLETNLDTDRRPLSDRLTPSLISHGLVKGITPTSTRNELGAAIPDFVLLLPDGTSVDLRSQDC